MFLNEQSDRDLTKNMECNQSNGSNIIFSVYNKVLFFFIKKKGTFSDIFLDNKVMSQKNPTALQKMQEIANRLISNTPELAKMLDNDSLLKPKRPYSPTSNKKGPTLSSKQSGINSAQQTGYNKSEMTANDYHERCKQLSSELTAQKDKCQQLQEEINIIKQRFVEREIQYRKIIQELQDEIKSKSTLDNADRNRMQNIKQLHSEIINNISSIQSKTSKILIEQESDIRRFFHKKINQIKEKFKEDKINKTQKDQQYQMKEKQMMSELQWIKNIAHKIDAQNQQIVKKYVTLKSQFEIQQKDKQILLKQLLMKKKENAVLKAQVQQYEKLLNQVSKQMQQEEVEERSMIIHDQVQTPFSNTRLPSVNPVKKQSLTNLLENSRSSQGAKDPKINKQSRLLSNFNYQSKDQVFGTTQSNIDKKSYDSTVNHLKSIILKQKKKVKQLKNLYMREIGAKSQLQKIIRSLVDDVRQSIVQVQKQRRKRRSTGGTGTPQQMNQEKREALLEKLLSNEKILTLIYDKTFYANHVNNKNMMGTNSSMMKVEEVPEQIQHLMGDDDSEGFT